MSAATDASRFIVAKRCALCAAVPASAWLDDGSFEWIRCGCGLVYKRSETVLPAAASGEHYDDAYFERYARRRRRRVAKSRRQVEDALEARDPSPARRLLDVGCSLGYTLEAARSLGLEASGVDVSPAAVADCRRRGLDAYEGSLDSLPFEDGSFDVAVLKHVFEHTPSPRAALAELKRVLKPGAAAFFAVPHLGYRDALSQPQRSRFFHGKAAREHYVYYSPATLSRLLEEEGFRVASVHPLLRHRRASFVRRCGEAALLPLRAMLGAAAGALALRKEFWLVAVRT